MSACKGERQRSGGHGSLAQPHLASCGEKDVSLATMDSGQRAGRRFLVSSMIQVLQGRHEGISGLGSEIDDQGARELWRVERRWLLTRLAPDTQQLLREPLACGGCQR